MRAHFKLESKKELYMAEMQTRTKKRKEDWAGFGEELKLLADKTYPDLQEEARERLALNQYLARLDDPRLGFSMRQGKPATVVKDIIIMSPNCPSSRRTPQLSGNEKPSDQ